MNNERITLYVIDLLAPPGHTSLVSNLVNVLNDKYSVVFISSSEYCSNLKSVNTVELDNEYFNRTNRFLRIKADYIKIKKIKNILKQNKKPFLVLFTSFENITFPILWSSYCSQTLALIHNNLDRKKFSQLFLKKTNNKIGFIVFENFLINPIKQITNNKVFTIPHVINDKIEDLCESYWKNEEYIFAPSRGSNFLEKYYTEFTDYLHKSNLILYMKGKKNQNIARIKFSNYFENYNSLINNAKYILINSGYKYRISGVFYEAMAKNKIVIYVDKTDFFCQEMKKKYPNSVFHYEEIDFKPKLKSEDFEKFKNLHSNNNILEKLDSAFEKIRN